MPQQQKRLKKRLLLKPPLLKLLKKLQRPHRSRSSLFFLVIGPYIRRCEPAHDGVWR
jgi:hypothetical protein